ncbi:MAG TPA: PSD1 and planctomycete cytochrome C domain-containing protein [Tepidisphaeraceae bacterium]|jgi:cytochrome c553
MRNVKRVIAGLVGIGVLLGVGVRSLAQAPSAADLDFFEKKIRPVLAQQCYKCHSAEAKKLKGKLLLDNRDGALKGGETGPAVVPGTPGQSLLIKAIQWTDKDLQMPPKEQLPPEVVADFVTWVRAGAPWTGAPQNGATVATTQASATPNYAANYDHLRKELWSWQPIANPDPPAVKKEAWVRDDIDRFVLAKLEENNLDPSPRADKLSLLRRVSFDLIGLPPTPEEIDAYLRDDSPKAFEKVVDRLLDSPRFGERWGRHWLDVARYAESSGMSRNFIYYYAWRYRDYVIDAFNSDKPYNQFVREQIAGDLLPANTPAEKDRLAVATGFLTVGPRDFNERNPRQFLMNTVDEQIDTVGRAFLATTIACARCHDHKFDPIPTAEYYSLAGIFASTDEFTGIERRRMANRQNPYSDDHFIKLSGYKAGAESKKDLDDDEVRAQARRALGKMAVAARLGQTYTQPSTPPRPLAMGVQDDSRPTDIRILVRGELDKPGDNVKRGFLSIPSMKDAPGISTGESGRLELAVWLTRADNPLTARVMVNRIWEHLFGKGLVGSVDNFGTTGDKPTHPQLLDHLATQFMKDGWSVKRMIRAIVLSNTYQQAATFDRAKYNVDPDNHLLWRMNQRRLEAEAIRDAMLAASGRLDTRSPIGSPALDLPPIEVRVARINPGEILSNMNYRSVYLPIFRNAVPEVLEAFDFADPNQVSGQRDVTTVAPQALFMLNNAFVTKQATALAARVANSPIRADAGRIDLAYKLTLGRPASGAERERAMAYVGAYFRDPAAATAKPRGRRDDTPRLEAFASFCQALMASAEFRYLN